MFCSLSTLSFVTEDDHRLQRYTCLIQVERSTAPSREVFNETKKKKMTQLFTDINRLPKPKLPKFYKDSNIKIVFAKICFFKRTIAFCKLCFRERIQFSRKQIGEREKFNEKQRVEMEEFQREAQIRQVQTLTVEFCKME